MALFTFVWSHHQQVACVWPNPRRKMGTSLYILRSGRTVISRSSWETRSAAGDHAGSDLQLTSIFRPEGTFASVRSSRSSIPQPARESNGSRPSRIKTPINNVILADVIGVLDKSKSPSLIVRVAFASCSAMCRSSRWTGDRSACCSSRATFIIR